MENLKTKFIVFLCALLVFISVPCTSVSAKYISNYNCVYFFVAGRTLYYWTGYSSGDYTSFSRVSDASSLFSSFPSDTYVFFAIRDDANGDLTENTDDGLRRFCILNDLHYVSLLDYQLNNTSPVSWETNSKVESLLLSYSSDYISAISPDASPDATFFPVSTPTPLVIYTPVDAPIRDVSSHLLFESSTGSNSGSSGNYQPTYSNSHLKVSLYINSELVSNKTIDVGSYLAPPVSSLGILSLYGLTYFSEDGNIYVNYNEHRYQYLEWKFYLRNGVSPYNVFGSTSFNPISTQLTGSRFFVSSHFETFYYDSFTGEKKYTSQPNYSPSYYASLTVDIKLQLVDGDIYYPPTPPDSPEDPFINPDFKPLIPPGDPTLNNPSSPPLSDGSSSLSNNSVGEGFDINHYLNFNFPVVLTYLGFLFTQSFNFLADNSIIILSVISVIVVAAIFLIIRERL